MIKFLKRLLGWKSLSKEMKIESSHSSQEAIRLQPGVIQNIQSVDTPADLWPSRNHQAIEKPVPRHAAMPINRTVSPRSIPRQKHYYVPESSYPQRTVVREDPVDNTDLNALIAVADALAREERSCCSNDYADTPVESGSGSFSGAGASGNWDADDSKKDQGSSYEPVVVDNTSSDDSSDSSRDD